MMVRQIREFGLNADDFKRFKVLLKVKCEKEWKDLECFQN